MFNLNQFYLKNETIIKFWIFLLLKLTSLTHQTRFLFYGLQTWKRQKHLLDQRKMTVQKWKTKRKIDNQPVQPMRLAELAHG